MRKVSVWVLCLGVALATAAFAGATGSPSGAGGDQAAVETPSFAGEVVTIYGASNTFLVRSGATDQIISLDDKTVFSPRDTSAANLRVGAKVAVWYKTGGETRLATKILIQPE